jgi:hypothetical protein
LLLQITSIFFLFSSPLFAEGFGKTDYMGGVGHTLLKGAAVKDSSAQAFAAVGRTWDNAAGQFKALIASYEYLWGGHDTNFGRSSGLVGRRLHDFSGAGLDNLCTSVVYANTGFIAACRSRTSSHYYKIYLVKVDELGELVTAFGTNGIKDTGIGGSSDDGLVRGIAYDSTNTRVVIVGAKGALAGTVNPFIATFNASTGAQVGSTTLITQNGGSSISGTAVAVTVDSTPNYYTASTETAANHNFYVHQFNTSLSQTGGSWGTTPDFTQAISGGAADSVPSGIAIIGTDVVTVGANRINTSSSWRCALTAHKISDGTLDTGFGAMNATLSGTYSTTANKGISLFANSTTRDCIINGTLTPPSGSTINVVGTIYNGSNYDAMTASLTSAGALNGSYGTSGIQTSAIGSNDDVLNSMVYMQGSASYFYAVGRSQDASSDKYNGSLTSKLTVSNGTVASTTSNTWTVMTTTSAPSIRVNGASAWTGYKFITWGGYTPYAAINTGGVYDPQTDTWTATTTTGAPATRHLIKGVWTGSKLLIFGGYTGAGTLPNTGGLYNPSNDSWTTTSTVGAPQGTSYPVQVWTGTTMITWSGFTNAPQSTYANTGGIYTPGSDTWTPVTTTGAPAPRGGAVGYWTGSKLLVFGGTGAGGSPVNTGGLYDPATDSWSSISATGAPGPVSTPVSVWTGNAMTIWAVNFTNVGAYYTPSSNTWTTMATSGAPGYRNSSADIWTGYRQISWGGYTVTNTGRIYNPVANSWSSTALANAPDGRYLPQGKWTGSRLLVFGGRVPGYVNSGGLYSGELV